jgi:hypothetical protein
MCAERTVFLRWEDVAMSLTITFVLLYMALAVAVGARWCDDAPKTIFSDDSYGDSGKAPIASRSLRR